MQSASLSFNFQLVDVYSMSWGPNDDGVTIEGPGPMTNHAIVNGIVRGRNGLGSIFVWAAGNGAYNDDDCNCDGYVNSIYTIAIGSMDMRGHSPYYSEPCAAVMVCPSGACVPFDHVTALAGGDIIESDGHAEHCVGRHTWRLLQRLWRHLCVCTAGSRCDCVDA